MSPPIEERGGEGEAYAFGIEGLDEMLGGGLRRGHVAVVTGSPMSGRELFGDHFFIEGLGKGDVGIYLTTRLFHTEIRTAMEERGWTLEPHRERFTFIDAYSPQSDPSLQDTGDTRYVASVADFAKLSNTMVSIMGQYHAVGRNRQRLVVDTLDTLLMYVSAPGVYRFLSYLRAKVKAGGAAAVLSLQPELHEEKDVRTITQLADLLIELDHETAKIRVSRPGKPRRDGTYGISDSGMMVRPG